MSRKLVVLRHLIAIGSASILFGLMAGGCASGGQTQTTNGGSGGTAGFDGGGATDGSGFAGNGGTGGVAGSGGSGAVDGGDAGGASGAAGASDAGGSDAGGASDGGGAGGASGASGAAGTGAGGCGSKPEICNGLDDNCNGLIDEGDPGGGAPCTVPGAKGVCAQGTKHCVNGIITCVADNQPSSEICDGLDNNCDGQVDEGNPGGNVACNTGKPGICASGTTACVNGKIVCNQNYTAAAVETCNGLDDNCNGQIDEGNPGGGQSCDTGKLGICAAGITDCQNGQLKCVQQNQPKAETCDGKDDDCNGSIDDNITSVSCNTGLPGVCSAGMTQCAGGVQSCNPLIQPGSQQETCNGKDDDCNGQVDDGPAATLCARNCGIAVIPNLGTMACTSGACIITSCPPGKYNSDGNYCTGCDATSCTNSPTPNTCASPISLKGTGDSYSGQLLTVNAQAWFKVAFTNPGAGNSYSPTITLAQGTSEYRMDVLTGCGGTAVACPAAGGTGTAASGTNTTSWSMDFNTNLGNCGGANQSGCTNNSTVPSPLYIKITRTAITGSGAHPECDPFAISITN